MSTEADIMWSNFETELNIKIPIYVKKIFAITGSDNHFTLKNFDQTMKSDIEEFVRESVPELIEKSQYSNYYHVFKYKPHKFVILPGHTKMLEIIRDCLNGGEQITEMTINQSIDDNETTLPIVDEPIFEPPPSKKEKVMPHLPTMTTKTTNIEVKQKQPRRLPTHRVKKEIGTFSPPGKDGEFDDDIAKFHEDNITRCITYWLQTNAPEYKPSPVQVEQVNGKICGKVICNVCGSRRRVFYQMERTTSGERCRWINSNFIRHFQTHLHNLPESQIKKKGVIKQLTMLKDVEDHRGALEDDNEDYWKEVCDDDVIEEDIEDVLEGEEHEADVEIEGFDEEKYEPLVDDQTGLIN